MKLFDGISAQSRCCGRVTQSPSLNYLDTMLRLEDVANVLLRVPSLLVLDLLYKCNIESFTHHLRASSEDMLFKYKYVVWNIYYLGKVYTLPPANGYWTYPDMHRLHILYIHRSLCEHSGVVIASGTRCSNLPACSHCSSALHGTSDVQVRTPAITHHQASLRKVYCVRSFTSGRTLSKNICIFTIEVYYHSTYWSKIPPPVSTFMCCQVVNSNDICSVACILTCTLILQSLTDYKQTSIQSALFSWKCTC